MHVIATFEPSEQLELAILALEEYGIEKECIAAVPMNPIANMAGRIDSLHRADEIGVFDAAAILGTVFAVIGASCGFQLHWGPIVWGLLGLAAGAFAGFVIAGVARRMLHRKKTSANAVVILIVRCEQGESHRIIQLIKAYLAQNIGTLA